MPEWRRVTEYAGTKTRYVNLDVVAVMDWAGDRTFIQFLSGIRDVVAKETPEDIIHGGGVK